MSTSPNAIQLVPHDPAWASEYEDEAGRIEKVLGQHMLRIEHVGSTSITGLIAKPVIDIQVSVASLTPIELFRDKLAELGYAHISLPKPSDPEVEHADEVYPFFRKPHTWPGTHHVHLCLSGSIQERNHILFRNYLRDHPEKMQEYEQLKRHLAAVHVGDTFESREQ